MKKGLSVAAIAVAAGCALIFTGCLGVSSCNSKDKKNAAAFSSNWYADTNYRYIQPTFIDDGENEFNGYEEITYTVTHYKETAGNSTYSVEYEDGEYKTTFYAKKFDKDLIDEEYKSTYPDNDITVYCYVTDLKMPSVTFKVGEEIKTFEDDDYGIYTASYFMDVNNHLRPLYSEQIIKMVSPAEYQVSRMEDAYISVCQVVRTSYKYDGSAAKTVIEGDDATTFVTDGLNKSDNSLIDVCGLNIAVRAMQLSESLSQVISVYSPAGRMQNYTFTGSSSALGEDERKTCESELAKNGLFDNTDESKSLSTVCVTTTLNANMKGVSQKYWFAAIDNAKNNKGRATMVKMSVPIPFALGTLNYSLKEITSTLY